MAIPRNLVYIFILAIVGAFAGMCYIVYFDIDMSAFTVSFNFSKVEAKVHPLFTHLQQLVGPPVTEVDTMKLKNVDRTEFYSNYVST